MLPLSLVNVLGVIVILSVLNNFLIDIFLQIFHLVYHYYAIVWIVFDTEVLYGKNYIMAEI